MLNLDFVLPLRTLQTEKHIDYFPFNGFELYKASALSSLGFMVRSNSE